MLHNLREVKCHQWYTPEFVIRYMLLCFSLLEAVVSDQVFYSKHFDSNDLSTFPVKVEYLLSF